MVLGLAAAPIFGAGTVSRNGPSRPAPSLELPKRTPKSPRTVDNSVGCLGRRIVER